MRELFIDVDESTAQELKLNEVRQNVDGQYLLREKDIAHLEGATTAEKAERINGRVLDTNKAMRFIQGKLNKRVIKYEVTENTANNDTI